LFYVAITRAKRLWITYANTRYRFGSLVQNGPCRFMDELPENFIDEVLLVVEQTRVMAMELHLKE
jgi:superfamily I DNA/RNA helicase